MRGIKTRVIESLLELGNAIYAEASGDLRLQIDDKLGLSGGVLTGSLTLAYVPSSSMHAVTKGYVDSAIATVTAGTGTYLPLIGGTLTGYLTLASDPAASLHAAPKQYVDAKMQEAKDYADSAVLAITGGGFLQLSGGTLTGALTLAGAPTDPSHAVPKSYVDNLVSTHNALLGLQGGSETERFHLSSTELSGLTSMLAVWASNGGAFGTSGSMAHDALSSVQGGTTGEQYHLTNDAYNNLTNFVPYLPYVVLYNQANTFGASQNFGSYKLLNVGTPTNPTDGVNKAYVDSADIETRKPRVVTYNNVSGALTVDWDNCDEARLNLTGNAVVTFSGGVDGQKLMLRTTQDSTGSRLLSLSGNVRYNADIPSIVLTTTANKTDRLGFIFDSTLGKYDVVAVAKGY